jgi:hypothetical protein
MMKRDIVSEANSCLYKTDEMLLMSYASLRMALIPRHNSTANKFSGPIFMVKIQTNVRVVLLFGDSHIIFSHPLILILGNVDPSQVHTIRFPFEKHRFAVFVVRFHGQMGALIAGVVRTFV